MRFKSVVKAGIFIAFLTGSLSTFAMNEQIRCPSAGFIKSEFMGRLNQVTRIEANRFVVEYWDSVFDAESQHHWSLGIYADTSQDYDFTEAYKIAQYQLTHKLIHPEKPYIDANSSGCDYIDQYGQYVLFLDLYHSNQLAKKMSHLKK